MAKNIFDNFSKANTCPVVHSKQKRLFHCSEHIYKRNQGKDMLECKFANDFYACNIFGVHLSSVELFH